MTRVALLSRDQIDKLPERAREVVEYRKSGLSLNLHPGLPAGLRVLHPAHLRPMGSARTAGAHERRPGRGRAGHSPVLPAARDPGAGVQPGFDVLRLDVNRQPPEQSAALIRDRLLAFFAPAAG